MNKPTTLINHREHHTLNLLKIINACLILGIILRGIMCIIHFDEPLNIEECWRIFRGNQYLVENWDFFQMGDFFMYPFLKVFYLITNSTDGIILYSRTVFIFVQFCLYFILYKILSKNFDKDAVLLSLLIFISSVSLKMYSMWYDNWELFFRFICLGIIFYIVQNKHTISNRHCMLLSWIAGMAGACMVYAYPTTILVFIYIVCSLFFYQLSDDKKKNTQITMLFIAGAAFIFFVFLIYAFKVGIRNLFVFNPAIKTVGEQTDRIENQTSFQFLVTTIKNFLIAHLTGYFTGFIFLIVNSVIACIIKKEKRKGKSCIALWIFFIILMISGGISLIVFGEYYTDTLNRMMLYFSFYTPLLYKLKSGEKSHYRKLILFVWIPSYIAGFMYSYTAYRGVLKFSSGAKTAAIVSLLLLYDILKETDFRISHKIVFRIISISIITINLWNLLMASYLGTPPLKCNAIFNSGVLLGIIDDQKSVEKYTNMEKTVHAVKQKGDETITCIDTDILYYLAADLKPNTYYLELYDDCDFNALKNYYDCYYGNADIIVINKHSHLMKEANFKEFIYQHYTYVDSCQDDLFYHKKN